MYVKKSDKNMCCALYNICIHMYIVSVVKAAL